MITIDLQQRVTMRQGHSKTLEELRDMAVHYKRQLPYVVSYPVRQLLTRKIKRLESCLRMHGVNLHG